MHIWRYAIATLPPMAGLILGAIYGGWWSVFALIWLTILTAFLDHVLAPPGPSHGHRITAEFLAVALAVGHLALLPLTVYACTIDGRTWGEIIPLFLGTASLMGQISHPNAHELIHRVPRALRRLGAAVYVSMLFGHHVSAHRLVHHAHVGTAHDPNTPEMGEGFWHFLPRAWIGSFTAGLAEERRRQKSGHIPPYLVWVGGGALCLILAMILGGLAGLVTFAALGALAQGQILLSDYIQHYGLSRLPLQNGRFEPVGPMHSWNAPRGFSSFLMVNAPSHSDHHMHPDRPYDTLEIPQSAPLLPWSLPVMAVLATMPNRWRKLMDKRAAKIMDQARQNLERTP